MIETVYSIEVRYGETDQMGIVNNANYASYYEIGRTDWLKKLGASYQQMEQEGIVMPVIDIYSKFHYPAYFEDTLFLHTVVKQLPTSRIRFDHKIYNQHQQLIHEGYCQLAFLDAKKWRPTRIPSHLKQLMKPHY